MVKPTKRKAFNFLRSYFDVLNEIPNKEDKFDFLMSIINKQFLNEDPINLNFIVNLCYESQRHSIESSVKGWERASNDTLSTTPLTPLPTPKQEEEEEVKEKEEEKLITPPAKAEVKIDFDILLSFINKTLNKNFRKINDKARAGFKARLKEGYTKEDIGKAIVGASKASYHLETNYKHLRPEFFNRADKIDMYSNTGTIPTQGLSIKEQSAHIKNTVGKNSI